MLWQALDNSVQLNYDNILDSSPQHVLSYMHTSTPPSRRSHLAPTALGHISRTYGAGTRSVTVACH